MTQFYQTRVVPVDCKKSVTNQKNILALHDLVLVIGEKTEFFVFDSDICLYHVSVELLKPYSLIFVKKTLNIYFTATYDRYDLDWNWIHWIQEPLFLEKQQRYYNLHKSVLFLNNSFFKQVVSSTLSDSMFVLMLKSIRKFNGGSNGIRYINHF